MSDYGVSSTGFKRKRLNLLLEELNSEVKAIFGDNFNVSPESPDGQINGVISESNANLWELAEEAYNAFNPKAASGVTLRNLVQLNGIIPFAATASRVELTISGDSGTSIIAGSFIGDVEETIIFSTDETVLIPSGGSVVVQATATVTGPRPALADTITEIITPVTGWDSVTNNDPAVLGTDLEKDSDLRARRERSVARDAQAVIDAIFAEIKSVVGVTQLLVLENDTNSGPDTNGLPAHSINAIVLGGQDQDIAKAIFLKKTLGATSFGNTSAVITDDQSIEHTVSFSRPTEIDIYVIVNLTTFANFPVDGQDLIKQAIIDYSQGILTEGRGFSLGDNVINSQLYSPVNTIQGHTVESLFIGTSAGPTSSADIIIAINEISVFLEANITVNI